MKTNPRLTEDTTLLRIAIEEALTNAKAPMTAVEVSQHPDVASLGLTTGRVRAELRSLYVRKKKLFPIARIDHYGHGNTQFAYYHPGVVQPLATPDRPAKVNDVYPTPEPEKFEFNPVELEDLKPTTESAPLAAPEESKAVATEARRITLEVAGVTIRIELT